MEKLLAKADDAFKNARYQETLTWLRQARALAPSEKQGEIDSRMKEVQKKADEGSLFAGMSPEAQPTATRTSQPENGIQPAAPQSVPQSAPQQAVSSTVYNQPEPSSRLYGQQTEAVSDNRRFSPQSFLPNSIIRQRDSMA